MLLKPGVRGWGLESCGSLLPQGKLRSNTTFDVAVPRAILETGSLPYTSSEPCHQHTTHSTLAAGTPVSRAPSLLTSTFVDTETTNLVASYSFATAENTKEGRKDCETCCLVPGCPYLKALG